MNEMALDNSHDIFLDGDHICRIGNIAKKVRQAVLCLLKTEEGEAFTNIEHGKRHEFLDLCTKAQLKKRGVEFPKYDNYKAVEVCKGAYIPKDHKGVMGVPITWLDKYNPEQFEIVGATESEGQGFSNGLWEGGKAQAVVNGVPVYKRIFIRHKPATEEAEA